MKPVKYHNFRGKRYKIERVPVSQLQHKEEKDHNKICFGLCNPPTKKHKKIKIASNLIGLEKLRVEIHEALHACDFDLSEELVDESSRDIAKLLWRLNYRES